MTTPRQPVTLRRILRTLCVAAFASLCVSATAHAQWTVTNLNPAGSLFSNAYAASGGQQAGYADVGGVIRASLWSGTAASWVDLHAFLPAGFSESRAQGISSDGVNTYIAGSGFNTLTSRNEALLWRRPLPPPPCPADFNGDGTSTVQDIFGFLAAWFAGAPAADFNGVGGTNIQDIFDFLAAWFVGC